MKGKGKKEKALQNGKHFVDEYSEGESGSSFPVRYRDLKKEKQLQVEVSKVTSSYEQKLSSMKAEHEAALQQSKICENLLPSNNLFFTFLSVSEVKLQSF